MTTTQATSLGGLQARMRTELTARLAVHRRRLDWDADQLAAHQADRLRALLARAIEHSPFHARRLGHIDPARFGLADLSSLPVMTKAEMMASFDDVVTDRRLSRWLAEEHLRSSGHEPSLLLGDYVCLTSGGSSGQRGVFAQTIGEYADHIASILRLAAARRAAAGAPAGMVAAMVAAASPVHSTGFVGAVCQGEPIHLVPVPDGTASARVLITNLHNLTQPLIRYELTDSFTACPGAAPGGHLQATANGRDDGMLWYGPIAVHPLAVRTVMAASASVTEYQVRQTQRGVDIAMVAGRGLDQAGLAARLTNSLGRSGLPDPEVTVRVVDAIARNPDTSKARRFIPLQTS